MNWRKTVYIVSSVAASVLIFFAIYLYYNGQGPKPHNPVATGPAASGTDSGSRAGPTQVASAANPKDTTNASPGGSENPPTTHTPGGKNTFALDGLKLETLPAAAIREADYPQPLSYTFSAGRLTIYGDPLLGLLYLNIYKRAGLYYLVYNNQTYTLTPTTEITRFYKQGYQVNKAGVRSSEKIDVRVASLDTRQYSGTPFAVKLVSEGGSNRYSFITERDKTILLLRGRFTKDNCTVVNLKKDGKANWYVVSGTHVYATNQFAKQLTELPELSGLASEEARLFIPRDSFKKTVLYLDK